MLPFPHWKKRVFQSFELHERNQDGQIWKGLRYRAHDPSWSIVPGAFWKVRTKSLNLEMVEFAQNWCIFLIHVKISKVFFSKKPKPQKDWIGRKKTLKPEHDINGQIQLWRILNRNPSLQKLQLFFECFGSFWNLMLQKSLLSFKSYIYLSDILFVTKANIRKVLSVYWLIAKFKHSILVMCRCDSM